MTGDCSRERLYVGSMALQSEVLLQAGHKWNNALFHNHTGLRVYPKYAMGGGYVLSGDVVDALVAMQVTPLRLDQNCDGFATSAAMSTGLI